MAELQPIIAFHSRHFVRHLVICKRIGVNLLQLMSGVITHNSVKKNEVSILINGWVMAKYSVSRLPFWNLYNYYKYNLPPTGSVRWSIAIIRRSYNVSLPCLPVLLSRASLMSSRVWPFTEPAESAGRIGLIDQWNNNIIIKFNEYQQYLIL